MPRAGPRAMVHGGDDNRGVPMVMRGVLAGFAADDVPSVTPRRCRGLFKEFVDEVRLASWRSCGEAVEARWRSTSPMATLPGGQARVQVALSPPQRPGPVLVSGQCVG